MVAKRRQDFAGKSVAELRVLEENLRGELFQLRLNRVTSHVKDTSVFKQLRRDIARVLTHIKRQS